MDQETANMLDEFIHQWPDSPDRNKQAFLRFKDHLAARPGTALDFKARPGVTYSLRAVHANQKDKSLFVMVDVIDQDPRWLSVCFYGEMITDPEARGDEVPEGLLGEDAVCFDLAEWDDELIAYIQARLDEAHLSAAG